MSTHAHCHTDARRLPEHTPDTTRSQRYRPQRTTLLVWHGIRSSAQYRREPFALATLTGPPVRKHLPIIELERIIAGFVEAGMLQLDPTENPIMRRARIVRHDGEAAPS